jgi:predicted GIY-YIG superfamily endonuclease
VLRDKLLARRRDGLDDRQLAEQVLGIRGAPPDLARKLVAQALVVGDRRDEWRRIGERVCAEAPAAPVVYILKDDRDRVVYVGKAVNLRRRLRAHFSGRRWRATKADFARASAAEWIEVGSDLEALLREAQLIAELRPTVNVQTALPALDTRVVPAALVKDAVILVPSIEADSAELVAVRPSGAWLLQRTRRNGADLPVHTKRLWKFFFSVLPPRATAPPLAPIAYSWLAGRGATATRVDPHAAGSERTLRGHLAALLRDERLFHERLEQC